MGRCFKVVLAFFLENISVLDLKRFERISEENLEF